MEKETAGISEVVGVILLIGVFAAVIGVIGITYFFDYQSDDAPAVNLRSEVITENGQDYFVLSHEGGDPLLRDRTKIILDGVDKTSEFKRISGDDWDQLENSESIRIPLTSVPDSIVVLNTQNREEPAILYLLGENTSAVIPTIKPYPTQTPSSVIPPVANFSGSSLSGGAPLDVSFTDLSSGPVDSWLWDFGDGNSSTLQNPDHTYTTFGIFTVSLRVSTPDGLFDTETKTSYITVLPSLSCTAEGLKGYYYSNVKFSGTPVERTDKRIYFADETALSYGYSNSDMNNWPVPVINQNDYFGVIYEGYVVIDDEDDYTFYLTSDDGSYLWIDNTKDTDTPVIDNWGQHPPNTKSSTVHLTQGNHRVKIKMYEQTGAAVLRLEWSSSKFERKITESFCQEDCCLGPEADFISDLNTGNAPLTVSFTDISAGSPASWYWDFGDGSTSTEQNPVHTYVSSGLFDVSLRVENSYGFGIENKTGYINVLSSLPCGDSGIKGYYYPTSDFTGTAVERVDSRLRFADSASVGIGYESDISNWPVPLVGKDNKFSVIYEGYLFIEQEDDYTFYLTSDDGSKLWIDDVTDGDTPLIDNWGLHPAKEISGTIHLMRGTHPVRVKMYENNGYALLHLEWSSGSFERRFVDSFCQEDCCSKKDFTLNTARDAYFNSGGSLAFKVDSLYSFITIGGVRHDISQGSDVRIVLNSDQWVPVEINSGAVNQFGASDADVYIDGSLAGFGRIGTVYVGNAVDTISTLDLVVPYSREIPSYFEYDGEVLMNWWPVDSSEVRLFNVAPDSTGLLRVDPMIYAKASAESYEIISYVPKPPVADFTYSQNSGNAPLFVQFTDTSTNDPENWEWNFGDGKTHSSQNPGHTYSFPGTYTVSLTASNGEGRSTETKENLITVDFTGPLTDIVLSTFNKKTGTLGQGGYLELVSSGDLSYVRVGGSDYTLADGDVVRFENPSDVINGRISLSGGSVYGSDLDMAFNVYKNGVYLGTGYPGGLIFYDEVRSTLVVTVSNRRGYMALAADGFTISDGKTTSGVHLYGLMPDDLGNMDLAMDSRHGVDYTGFVYDYDITY